MLIQGFLALIGQKSMNVRSTVNVASMNRSNLKDR